MNNKNVDIFSHIHTFGSMKLCIFPVNEETFKGKRKNTQTKQRKIRPQAAVSRIPPPPSCLQYRRCVGCSEQQASQKASIHHCKMASPRTSSRLASARKQPTLPRQRPRRCPSAKSSLWIPTITSNIPGRR